MNTLLHVILFVLFAPVAAAIAALVLSLLGLLLYGLVWRPWRGLYRGLRYKDWSEFEHEESGW